MIKDIEIKINVKMSSDFLLVEDIRNDYLAGKETHWRDRVKEYLIKPKQQGLYFLYDNDKNVIYIGKAKDIRGRIHQHLTSHISGYLKGYEVDKILKKREKTKFVSYSLVDDYSMIDFMETGLINKYQPILNIQFKNI